MTKAGGMILLLVGITPDTPLEELAEDFYREGFSRVLAVADGFTPSISEAPPYLDILAHSQPLGLGRSVKTGINRYLSCCSHEAPGLVLYDPSADLFTPKEALDLGNVLAENPERFYLAVRERREDSSTGIKEGSSSVRIVKEQLFSRTSRLRGLNWWGGMLFGLLAGVPITSMDSQSGLRALGNGFLQSCLTLEGERQDYMTHMVLESKRQGIEVVPCRMWGEPLGWNLGRFNPLTESSTVYKPLISFLWTTIAAVAVNILIFWILSYAFSGLKWPFSGLLSTALAQFTAAGFQFILNRNLVFQHMLNKEGLAASLGKYLLLWLMQVFCSFGGMTFFAMALRCSPMAVKVPLDTLLFLISFQLQRDWVFSGKPLRIKR